MLRQHDLDWPARLAVRTKRCVEGLMLAIRARAAWRRHFRPAQYAGFAQVSKEEISLHEGGSFRGRVSAARQSECAAL